MRAGDVGCQFGRAWPPASLSSAVRQRRLTALSLVYNIIRISNLIISGAVLLIAAVSFIFTPAERFSSGVLLVVYAFLVGWLVSAFFLMKEDRVWPWVDSAG